MAVGHVPRWSFTIKSSSERTVPNTNCQHSLSKRPHRSRKSEQFEKSTSSMKRFKAKQDARRRLVAYKLLLESYNKRPALSPAAAEQPVRSTRMCLAVKNGTECTFCIWAAIATVKTHSSAAFKDGA